MIYRLLLLNGNIDFATLTEAEAHKSVHGGEIVQMEQDYKPEIDIEIEQPIIVAAWQLRLQLTKMGLNTFVDDIINTMVDPELQMKVRVVWEYGNTIKSDSPLIEMMRHEMQLSKEEVREIFTIANNIEL